MTQQAKEKETARAPVGDSILGDPVLTPAGR
jgi:hypothetical protein